MRGLGLHGVKICGIQGGSRKIHNSSIFIRTNAPISLKSQIIVIPVVSPSYVAAPVSWFIPDVLRYIPMMVSHGVLLISSHKLTAIVSTLVLILSTILRVRHLDSGLQSWLLKARVLSISCHSSS